MKKILLGVAVLFGLAIAAALIGPNFVDWNNYKGQIAQQAVEITGRAVQIDGDVSLRVVPAPELSAKGLRIANAEQGSDADMATVEQLQVRVAFWPLLKGQVQVESVSLVKPKLLLEVYADGRNNWTLGALSAQTGEAAEAPADPRTSQRQREEPAPGTAADAEDSLRIDSLSLRGATLLYRDATSGIEETLQDLDADILAESLRGPFSLKGTGRFRGHKTEFEIASGRWVDTGATQLSASLALPAQQAKAQFSGTVSRHIEGISLRGNSRLSGENLGEVLLAGGVLSEVSDVLAKPFRLETQIAADSERFAASEILLALAEVEVSGDIELEHRVPRKARVTINASRLDLDSLFEIASNAEETNTSGSSDAAGQGPVPAPSTSGAAIPQTTGFFIPSDLEASIQIVVDAAIYRQQVLRQILLSADVTDGRLVIAEAAALLPGGSDIALTGMLSTPEGVPNFDGRLDAAADNLRGVLQWVGVDVGAVPADRLRKTTFSSRVTATPDLVTISDLDLLVDVTRINGGISVAVRERPGFGIGLAVDRLDLDAYLPRTEGAETSGRAAGAAQPGSDPQATENDTARNGGSTRVDEPGPGLSLLDRFDANLDLRVNSLSYNGASARNLHLDGTLQTASLVVRSLTIADVSGAGLQAAGRIDDLTGEPAVDGRFTVKVDDPSRLEPLFGKTARDLERLGAFDLEATLAGSLQDLSVDGSIAAQGGQVAVAGQLRSIAVNPAYDLSLDAKHPDFNGLLRVLAPDAEFSAGPGAFALTGQLAGSQSAMSLSGLKIRAGALTAEGQVGADFSADVPRVSVDLSTGEIKTRDLKSGDKTQASRKTASSGTRAANPSRTGGGSGSDSSGGGATADLSAVHRRWSRDPIDLSGLGAVDGDIAVRSKAIIVDDLRLDNASLEAALENGVLSVKRFDAGVYGGRLRATGTVDGRGAPTLVMKLDATGLNAGRLIRDLADSDRISGTLDLSAALETKGESEAALVRSLQGSGQLGGQMTARVKAEEQLGNVVLGILGTKVKEIRGVSDATTALFSAFAGAPAKLSGTFNVQQGVVETVDTRIDGRDASIFTAGKADLPAWLLSSRSDLFRSGDANQVDPYVIAEANGVLDAPNVKVRGEAFKRNKSGSSGSSSSPQKIEPEEAIRGLLKDLIR
ncbi:AsmA family protein [Denitrobaculum tricleocarpae]|uniref:AsmA family protein n=1 Tax=Denitrobaculum tricleocarpae TaxID=2591009 RepID=A0A545T0V8_9PROT|nr:AsmA family protein [Denitrobaculum tricleocarpae]TQV70846.1 AsmA family protein [Denitrobaculum tricleocarpae]